MNKTYKTIEELWDMAELASTVWTDWEVDSDACEFINVYHRKNWVNVTGATLHQQDIIIVTLGSEKDIVYAIQLPQNHQLANMVIRPMIEQHLNGDRTELKSGLTDYLNISPAIK